MATNTKRSPRRRNRDGSVSRDPDGTRQALMKSAVALFEQSGYDATPVQRIVDDAGLTKGAFYHHFKNKEELIWRLHDEFIDFQLERARNVVARDAPTDELLTEFVIDVLMEPLGIYKAEITVFLQERRFISEKAFAEIKTKRDEFENLLVGLIERGMDSGVFARVGPPRVVAFGVIGMCAWSYTWLKPTGPNSPREIGEIYARILVDGLRAK